MGHSFGGLVTELLLDRGLGAAGVALSPAPVKGVLRLPPAQLRSAFPVLGNPANRNKTVELTAKQFNYAFTNTMTEGVAKAAYDRYEVPGPGRVIFQAAFANFNPRAATKADFHKDDRPRLLIIGTVRTTRPRPRSARRRRSVWACRGAVVEYKEFSGRPHFTAGAPRWEEVADYAVEWATSHASPARPETGASAG